MIAFANCGEISMFAAKNIGKRKAMCRACHVLVWGFLPVFAAYGQGTPNQTEDAVKAKTLQVIASLKEGQYYGPATSEEIAEAQAGQLVALFEERFVHGQDVRIKARVAKALVDLGDKGQAYWDCIAQQAKLAIESDAPSTRCYSSTNCTGHSAYVVWARAHNAPEDSKAEMELNWLMEERVQLVFGDPRGISLLREALKSPNINVAWAGADGLTRNHDKDSIPLIAEACKRFHDPDDVRQIAHTLRQFMRDPDTRAAAQAAEEQCLPPPDPIEALKRNDGNSLHYVREAAAKHPAETVAILKKNFAKTEDERLKAGIASTLIGLGDKENIYWDFLLRQATSVLESEASSVVKNDSQGKPIDEPLSEEAWVKQNRELNEILTFVETVAETRDPRGVRLLRRALSSPDSETQNFAAYGLARAQDKDSIPLIIDVCKNARPDLAAAIASNALVYFDDPRAQSAVDQYLTKEQAKFAREEKANRWSSWADAAVISKPIARAVYPTPIAHGWGSEDRRFGEGREP
jgi:HEAT repeat protein